jgi:hypothetical protein
MIESMLNLLLYGCGHSRVTRPITPFHRPGTQPGDTYVSCLECGKQFHYDLANMRIGKPRPTSAIPSGVTHFQPRY